MKTHTRLLWVGWILAVLAAAGCDEEEPDTCDRPSPGFLQEWLFVPLPEVPFVVLGEGEPCWMNKCFPSKPEFQIKNHYAVEDDYDRRRCRSDLFCHQELGCQPRISRGESCDHVDEGVFRGVCVEYEDVCYPSEPEGSDPSKPGPRVCRPVPSAEGEWCDPSTLSICRSPEVDAAWNVLQEFSYQQTWDIDVVPEVERFIKFNMHSGVGKRVEEVTKFPEPADFPEGESYSYSASLIRPLQLVCGDYECVKAPEVGEACAELSIGRFFPSYGHLKYACAQPLSMAVPAPEKAETVLSPNKNLYRIDKEQAVFCIEGICQAFSDLEEESCFQLTGADTEEDPSFCSQLAVGASSSPDFSPCREDGTCGLCNTCEFWDGSVIAVESEEECPGAGTGTPWQTKEEYRSVSHTSYPDMGCGRTMSVHFSDLEPSPGDLVLRLLVAGDMEPGTRFFTLSINDETEEIVVMDGEETGFVWETHDPDDCFETQGSAPEPYCTCPLNKDASVELLLADRWKNEEKLKIAVVGNEEWCLECETRLRAQLFHRVTSYKETVRDDRICP